MIPYLAIVNVNPRDIILFAKALKLPQKDIEYFQNKKKFYDNYIIEYYDHTINRGYTLYEYSANSLKNLKSNTDVKHIIRVKNVQDALKKIKQFREDFPEYFI